VRTPDEKFAYIHTALEEQARGVSLPFALVEKPSNRAIGSTRYGSIAPIRNGRRESPRSIDDASLIP
jgi:hypothetical protein